LAERVRARRERAARRDAVLWVGRFAAHKNVDRLLAGFARTRFAATGGELVLVADRADARTRRALAERRGVTLQTDVSEDTLDELYATCRLLVMPSLEEGFGLPVWEAIACGLPVCVSDGGALPEIARGFVKPFPATSVDALAAAIDTSLADERDRTAPVRPSLGEFAAELVATLERVA
jgi:glycosyltransferase involved in cell wall biosynthesis